MTNDVPQLSNSSTVKHSGTLKWYTGVCVALVSVVAVLLGYDIGIMSGAILFIEKSLNLTVDQKEISVGCLNFVSGFGSLLSSPITELLGCPRAMGVSLSLYSLGMLIVTLAFSFESLFAGRLITGLGVGIGFAVCPQYVAELSPSELRGVLVSFFEIFINVGLLLGYTSAFAFYQLPSNYNWRLMMAVPILPALVCLGLMFTMPESPRWLLARGRAVEAKEVLKKTCPEVEVDHTLAGIKAVVDHDLESPRVSWLQMVTHPSPVIRWALLIGIGTSFFQQANGSEAAVYYVPFVLEAAGVRSLRMQLLGALVVGAFKTIFVVVGQLNLDLRGRRPVLLVSIVGVTGGLVLLSVTFAHTPPDPELILAGLCLFVAAFAVGEGPVTWVIASEVFPLSIRSKAMSLSMAVNRMTSGTIALTFLSLSQALTTSGAFGLFACISAVHFVFTYFLIPETKGKSLEEIEDFLTSASGSIPVLISGDHEIRNEPLPFGSNSRNDDEEDGLENAPLLPESASSSNLKPALRSSAKNSQSSLFGGARKVKD
mmetsp:Transcript_22750/g.31713  ORF Transcript_22750/g.31713 Transcript_22750/m.31713 type:complete len:542 (+) Transcript_22750:174-1799(+)|eukprot:CAMPEP_0196594978 /NCGR_PEP_ID=MMETSP1081-20130531/79830_1 /TAXON_ID=36882 /ORGANISM="Pyramimonas amylifera, Strain CCMP720" /LENGTH=541 /DNA_ID=CAMNT_0041919401 /DNA_START=153 /DNA_END=1778 /DNA_ORIENTATION=+